MPKKCIGCSKEFPFKIKLDGKARNLKNRQYCLDCSPFREYKVESDPKLKRKKHHLNIKSKTCTVCNLEKDKECFYIKTSGNLSSYCKGCATIKRRKSKQLQVAIERSERAKDPNYKERIANIHPNLKVDFFKEIDSAEKAYWLGFLYADGYVTKDCGSLRLKLGIKDEETLDKFITAVGADPSLKKQYGPYETSGISKEITIRNKEFVGNLINLGCTTKKSLTIRFPTLDSKELDLAFLMGFYDGDGSEGSNSLTCGSKDFLNDICDKFSLDVTKIKKIKENIFSLYLGADLFRKMLDSYHASMSRKRRTHKDGAIIIGSPYKTDCTSTIKKRIIVINGYKRKKKFEVTKEELHELVWSMSSIEVGKKFGVSSKAIEKHCKKLGVHKPPPGYWNKVYAGKNPND